MNILFELSQEVVWAIFINMSYCVHYSMECLRFYFSRLFEELI